MTAQEAIAGFQELSRHFRQGYKWGELEPIWPELLECSRQSMVRTVGILIKNGKRRPEPGYVLSKVKWWHMNLEPLVEREESTAARRNDPDAEGREFFTLMKARLAGELESAEYASRLFSMAERYGKPGYAVQAHELLASSKS